MASKADDERRAFALSSGLGRNALVFSDDDLVHLLRAAIEREGSQIAFAKHYGVNRIYLNMILSGKKTCWRRSCKGPWASQSVHRRVTEKCTRPQRASPHVYFEDEPGRRSADKLLSKDEARRIKRFLS
jgi:hypothetical protein